MSRAESKCEICGKDYAVWAVKVCPVCGRSVCGRCETFRFGRAFCSEPCAGYYVYGDSDSSEVDEET